MAYFKELNDILESSVLMLKNNQNICKLLEYYPSTIDFRYNPLAQKDIKDTDSLIMKSIFPLPKIPDADTKQNCFIGVWLQGGTPMRENNGYRRALIVFDIICHLDAWIINQGYRPICILQEIDSMFNNKNILSSQSLTESKPQYQPFHAEKYANKFYGYQVAYDVIINSNISCGGN